LLHIELMFATVVDMTTGEAGDQLQELREAIEGLDLPVHGTSIAEARALLDRLTATVAAAEADYCAAGGWQIDGFGSMAAFARHRYRVSDAEGRRTARRAERMAVWPEMLQAWIGGTLTGAKVDATVGLVPERHVERFAATAGDNVAIVAPLNLSDTREALRHWVTVADAAAEREASEAGLVLPVPERERDLSLSRTIGDVADVRGLLDPDSATIVEQALRTAETPDVEGVTRTPAQRRADALVDVCRFFNDNHATGTRNRRQARLTVVADITTLYRAALRGAGVRTAAQLERFLAERPNLGAVERGLFLDAFDGTSGTARTLDGNPISDGLLSCISSSGVLERLLTTQSRILDMARTMRTFTDAQHRAAAARDQGCRRAGCDKPLHMTSLHHVEPWEAGGLTDIANAVHKCDHDHLDDHTKGHTDELAPDGTYTVITATGERLTTRPPGWAPPAQRPRLELHTTAQPAPELPFRPVEAVDHLFDGPPRPDDRPPDPTRKDRVPLLIVYAA
jgi:hypothetical protein